MTLYEIDQQIIKAIEFGYDPETGEILDDSALKNLQMERDEKIENMLLYVKDLRAEQAAIKSEIDTLEARRKASMRKEESITRYVQASLAGEKFKTARCAVSYRKTTSVQITDFALIPDTYIRRRVLEEPDKVAIKDALKAGDTVNGAYLEEHQSMSIK